MYLAAIETGAEASPTYFRYGYDLENKGEGPWVAYYENRQLRAVGSTLTERWMDR